MKQDGAEELARIGKDRRLTFAEQERLCDHILSVDYKREIENAAYRRAVVELDAYHYAHPAEVVRALITPTKTADTEG